MGGGGAPDRSGDVASAGLLVLDWHLAIFGFRPTPAHIEATPRGRLRRLQVARACAGESGSRAARGTLLPDSPGLSRRIRR